MTDRYFAKLDENNVVSNVIVWDSSSPTLSGAEAELTAFWTMFIAPGAVFKETSMEGAFRGTYAGIGYTYDADNDIFVSPAP